MHLRRRARGLTVGVVVAAAWGWAAACPAQPMGDPTQRPPQGIGPMVDPIQRPPQVEEPAGNNVSRDSAFAPADRSILRRLSDARQLLEQQRYGEAVICLGAILEGPEDYFFQPDADAPVHRSLKAEAQRLIGQMPPEGRDLYELQYGARARQRLVEALAGADESGLAEVSRQFFHTRAGYEATLLLGISHMDQGRPLAGALSLQRLREAAPGGGLFEPAASLALATCWLQAGMPEEAQDVLCGLKSRLGGRGIDVAGSSAAWFSDKGEAVEWLAGLVGSPPSAGPAEAESWVMFRGDQSRNASTSGGAPLLNVRWRIPTSDQPLVEAQLRRDSQLYRDRDILALPALHPLVVHREFAINRPGKPPWQIEDVVLMRSHQNLLAVDLATGKRIWETRVSDPLDALLGSGGVRPQGSNLNLVAAGAGHRLWDDASYGTISSDGQCVLAVEDLPTAITVSSSSRLMIVNGQVVTSPAQQPFNRLAAYDIATGKLVWELGGPAKLSGSWPALPLAGTFFLGPPMPLMGTLYVLGETSGEIRVFALQSDPSAPSGSPRVKVLWSQQLVSAERDILQDPMRALAGASPSYAEGVLVCPTSSGTVVAMDLATRSLLWGYRYERDQSANSRPQAIILQAEADARVVLQERWLDATAIVSDGRVVVVPSDADSLYCLDLLDGNVLWTCPRGNSQFVACVHGDNVVLVGRREVRAVSLSETAEGRTKLTKQVRTGGMVQVVTVDQTQTIPKAAWNGRSVSLPEGSMPSGRGYLSGDRYFLPLSSAEVAIIDVTEGKLVEVSKSRQANVPGNLVCYREQVISQGVDGLEVFSQLDAARREAQQRLAADPDDPLALALEGEVLLQDGRQLEAIASLRRSCALEPAAARTRSLLRDALLDGLRRQFAAYRDSAAEIEGLLDAPEQRRAYLRLMAAGLQATGEWPAALEHYLMLVDLDQGRHTMEPVADDLTVRQDRWIGAQLAALRREAGNQADQIEQAISARLRAAMDDRGLALLQEFVDCFGDHPAAVEARRELARRLGDSGRWLEAEQTLWPQQQSADPSVAAQAVAELAELFRQVGSAEDAAWCYSRLGQEFADVVCSEGKTGRELLAALPEGTLTEQAVDPEVLWPTGKVEEKSSASSTGANSQNRTVPYRGGLGPFFSETAIDFDQNRRMITARDALGGQRWQFSLPQAEVQSGISFSYATSHARVRGHLLLLSLGQKILAFDALGPLGGGQPRLLWSKDVGDPLLELTGEMPQVAAIQVRGGTNFQVLGGGAIQVLGGNVVIFSDSSIVSSNSVQTTGLGPLTATYTCFQRDRELVAVDPLSGEVLWVRSGTVPRSTLFGDEEVVFALPSGGTEATVFRAADGKLLGTRNVPRLTSMTQISGDGTTQSRAVPVGLRGSITSRAGTTTRGGTVPGRSVAVASTCLATLGRRLLVLRDSDGGSGAVLALYDPWEQRELWASPEFSPVNARFDMVGEEVVGMLEPGGRFLLVALHDGRTIADANLRPEQNLTSISVLRSGDQYFVMAGGHKILEQSDGNPTQTVQALSGNLCTQVPSGRLYAFDMEGNLAWPEPVEINDQYLLLSQPSRLPVLVFACMVRRTVQSGDRAIETSARQANLVSALCIDKRTGRVVYQGEVAFSGTSVALSGDPETNTVQLVLGGQNVTLTFTDQPIPPASEPPKEPVAAPANPQAVPDIWEGFVPGPRRGAAAGGAEPPGQQPPVSPVPPEVPRRR